MDCKQAKEEQRMRPDQGWTLQAMAQLSNTEFDNWCQLLEERAGIVWSAERKSYLEVKLTARMRELGVSDYADYFRQIQDGARGALEWSWLLDRLTVQETGFFRHPPSFDFVGEHLQHLLSAGRESLSLWSVGCSTGEEAWSLAMSAADAIDDSGSVAEFSVLASDVSRTALAAARTANYQARRSSLIDARLRERYLQTADHDSYRVCDSLKRQVCFSRVNILALADMPVIGMDVIFCQNVLIYFRRWKRRNILNQLARRLLPGGVLVLGVGEISGWEHPQLVPVDNDRILAFARKE